MASTAKSSFSNRVLYYVSTYALITVGVLLLALANDIFLIPNNVFSGGATGIALVINSYLPVPVGVLVLLINIPLVLAGIMWLGGWRFLVRTTYAVLVYSILLDLLRPLFTQPVTTDPLLYTLYGGLLGGVGVGLVFRAQGTTGGDDIIAQLLHRFRGIPVNSALVMINAAILVLVGLRFGPEKALYALISAFAASKAVDFVLEGLRPTRLIYIISSQPTAIAERIQTTTGRGITFLTGQGAYEGKDYQVILTAVRQQELPTVTNIVRELDPAAFVIVSEAREVLGYGFKPLPTPQAPVSLPSPLSVVRRRVRHIKPRSGAPTP
ncbi:MAG: YitT family protein [Chloroflexota bacterium]